MSRLMGRLVGLVLVAALGAGCTLTVRHRVHIFPRCADGLPPLILIDQACPPDAICGYSCLPGRWQPPDP